eukprot:CAMPEP_0170652674 /NCGR_PEP_ID=MMETSP0224-20130122/47021_1 /TAXON_ID=285029 /ORGANISM="Togula jolla, Strain CCCM 725" /LENGTH=109 /DNA_ID=CAMNT_0010984537 /DNA_START=58 /DNA_END=387 /DNA_ORIENTATION=+
MPVYEAHGDLVEVAEGSCEVETDSGSVHALGLRRVRALCGAAAVRLLPDEISWEQHRDAKLQHLDDGLLHQCGYGRGVGHGAELEPQDACQHADGKLAGKRNHEAASLV